MSSSHTYYIGDTGKRFKFTVRDNITKELYNDLSAVNLYWNKGKGSSDIGPYPCTKVTDSEWVLPIDISYFTIVGLYNLWALGTLVGSKIVTCDVEPPLLQVKIRGKH